MPRVVNKNNLTFLVVRLLITILGKENKKRKEWYVRVCSESTIIKVGISVIGVWVVDNKLYYNQTSKEWD